MNNNLVNEIAVARGDRLMKAPEAVINKEVVHALTCLEGEHVMNGLQGLDAECDGVTKPLWEQAVTSAEMTGALVYPQYMDDAGIPDGAEPCSFGEATCVIAGRVARAILIVNGMANWDSWESKEDWYLL